MTRQPTVVVAWTPPGSALRRCRFHKSCSIGRAPDNRIIVPGPTVSRHHAELVLNRGRLHVRNLSRAGELLVGRRPLAPGRVAGLRVNDTVVIDSTILTVITIDAQTNERVLRCVNPTCNRTLTDRPQDCPWCGTSTAFAETHPGG